VDFQGALTVSVTVSDGKATSAPYQTLVTVTPVNDVPVVEEDHYYTGENTSVNMAVLANDHDLADGINGGINPASLQIVQSAGHGICLVLANGNIVYTPYPGFSGTDQFTYRVSDVGFPMPALSGTAKVVVDVARMSPVCVADAASVLEDEFVDIHVLTNDSDSGGDIDASTLSVFSHPIHGNASVQPNGVVRYRPNVNYHGEDLFSYTVRDLTGLIGNVGTVRVTVLPVNDAPVALTGQFTTREAVAVTIPLGQLASDPDGDIDWSRFKIVKLPSSGTVSVDVKALTVVYRPNTAYSGADLFEFTVVDSHGVQSNRGSAAISVSNESPMVVDDVGEVAEDSSIALDVMSNDSDLQGDLDGASLMIIVPPAHGIASVDARSHLVNYYPALNYYGVDEFSYQVCDNDGYCGRATVRLTVHPVNDAPLALDDFFELDEDESLLVDVLLNDSDGDGQLDAGSISVVRQPAHGQVVVDAQHGRLLVVLDNDFFGDDELTYRVCDDRGACSQAVAYLKVRPVNDAPVAVNDKLVVETDERVVFTPLDNDSDVDDGLNLSTLTLIVAPTWGKAEVLGNGQLSYQSDAGYVGVVTLRYRVCDVGGLCAQADVEINVVSGNQPPVAVGDLFSVNEDQDMWLSVLDNDFDSRDHLLLSSLTVVEAPLHGWATVDASAGKIIYRPDADYWGVDYLRYKVCDDNILPLCAEASVSISVMPVNDAPVGHADHYEAFDVGEYNWNVLINDTDVDDTKLSCRLVDASGIAGEVTLSAQGWLRWRPLPGCYCSVQSLMYEVCDPAGECDVVQVLIDVQYSDWDGDGIPDAVDGDGDSDGDGLPNYRDADSDGDGIDDTIEGGVADVCTQFPVDSDGDGVPDFLDADADGDGVPDAVELTDDCDGDGIPNHLDVVDDCTNRVLVPDTFTPNGDGVNDRFVIPIVREYPINRLTIFNRWGNQVYVADNYRNDWDGRSSTVTMGTNVLPEGTYFYVLTLGVESRLMKGIVYLKK
ncbi:gliding motility-associated-like protein, partial [Breznakibacter xylanolyticus]